LSTARRWSETWTTIGVVQRPQQTDDAFAGSQPERVDLGFRGLAGAQLLGEVVELEAEFVGEVGMVAAVGAIGVSRADEPGLVVGVRCDAGVVSASSTWRRRDGELWRDHDWRAWRRRVFDRLAARVGAPGAPV
jgi:hypothetical protein